MRTSATIALVAAVILINLRADLVDFSGLSSVASLPMSFPWRGNDGSVGTVTVSLLSSPSSGTPTLVGSSSGGFETGLQHATGTADHEASWFVRLSFDNPVSLEVRNFETYTWYERTHLVTDGSPWTGSFSTNALPGQPGNPANGAAVGLQSDTLTLYGTTAAFTNGWPYGVFQSDSVKTLDVGYGVTLANGADANGVQIQVLSTSTQLAGNSGCVPAPVGLVGWWPGDGNANDLAGGNDGILVNATNRSGLVGEAFAFAGQNSFVHVPSSPALRALTNALTLEAWVWHDTNGPSYQRYLTVSPDEAYLRLEQGQLLSWVVTVTAKNGQVVPLDLAAATPIEPRKWYHVAGTYDGNMQLLYTNGVLAGSAVVNLPRAFGALREVFISIAGQSMNGLIDEPAIYNRVLTADEIQSHFAAGSEGMCKVVSFTDIKPLFPGTVRLGIKGPPLATLEVQTSTNLVTWSLVDTILNFTGKAQVSDPSAGGFSHRVYRALSR